MYETNNGLLKGSLSSENELIVDGHVVAVVYFRAGYEPGHYHGKKEWDARLMIERWVKVLIVKVIQLKRLHSVQSQVVGYKMSIDSLSFGRHEKGSTGTGQTGSSGKIRVWSEKHRGSQRDFHRTLFLGLRRDGRTCPSNGSQRSWEVRKLYCPHRHAHKCLFPDTCWNHNVRVVAITYTAQKYALHCWKWRIRKSGPLGSWWIGSVRR